MENLFRNWLKVNNISQMMRLPITYTYTKEAAAIRQNQYRKCSSRFVFIEFLINFFIFSPHHQDFPWSS